MSDVSVDGQDQHAQATFGAMEHGSARDWAIIDRHETAFKRGHADRVLEHLKILQGDHGGFAVDRLEHSLQTATRAHQAGEDEEYIVCALLHDIGDTLGCANHADVAAAIVAPYVSEDNRWMIEHHGIFQGYYFFDHIGLDGNMREQFRGHPLFDRTAKFCHLYDQSSFERSFKSMPLKAFEPMVHRVLGHVRTSIYNKPAEGTLA